MALENFGKQIEKTPDPMTYLGDKIKEQLTQRIVSSTDQIPDTPRSYELMANYISTEAKKIGVSLETKEDIDAFFEDPLKSHFALAYAAQVRKQMEQGSAMQ